MVRNTHSQSQRVATKGSRSVVTERKERFDEQCGNHDDLFSEKKKRFGKSVPLIGQVYCEPKSRNQFLDMVKAK